MKCDYDLISLFPGDPCPECGTEIVVHAPKEGVQRFENDPTSKLPFVVAGAGACMIFWHFYGIATGIPLLVVLVIFFAIPLFAIAIAVLLNGERRLAVTLDWNERRVIFERCYRSNAYWLSLRRKRVFECRMDEILAAEVQHGRGWDNLRIITPAGIANVPDSFDQWDDLCRELVGIASDTPNVPFHRTSLWLIMVAMILMAVVVGGVLYWAFVMDTV